MTPDPDQFERNLKPNLWTRIVGGRLPTTSPTQETAANMEILRKGSFCSFIRRHPKKLAIICALSLLTFVLTIGSKWMMEGGEDSDTDCSNRDDDDDVVGTSESCAWRPRLWLLVPRISPLYWRQARAKDLGIAWSIKVRDLTRATKVTLDPEAQRRVLDDLNELDYREGWEEERRGNHVFSLSAWAGMRESTAKMGKQAEGAFNKQRAIEAAIGSGDLPRATELAAIDESNTHSYEYHMSRGALLCLIGQEQEGREALEKARQFYRLHISREYQQALMGLLACGAPPDLDLQGTYREAVLLSNLFEKDDGHPPLGPLVDPRERFKDVPANLEFLDHVEIRSALQSPFVAVWLLSGDHSIERIIDVIGNMRTKITLPLTRWDLRMEKTLWGEPVAIDPDRHERAADRLETLAVQIDNGTLKVGPLDMEGRDRALRYDLKAQSETLRLREKPTELLRAVARFWWLQAALARTGQIDRKGVMRGLDRAFARSPATGRDALGVAAFALWAGDRKRAKAALDEAAKAKEPEIQLLVHVNYAQMHLHDGRNEEAYVAASKALEYVEPTQNRIVKARYHATATWVFLAAAIRTDRQDSPIKLTAPHQDERLDTDWGYWRSIVFADEATRRDARLRRHIYFEYDSAKLIVLPEVLAVVAHIARDGKDPEVWLDNALPLFEARLNGANGMRARAEAARYRGDQQRAEQWDAKAAQWEQLSNTPQAALLARLAGLN